ncbi:3-oxoadipate enol-lactonase [Rhodoblastus sp.]|jgi:3-oxoadipate enol-lactonase|uniref:3-oxoadipate enol-lactonase n=1 Tax=Rhodoblastus sp. TaxID=1962975 RepID=UPI0026192663|nr:3-oxoadipate enol-lactonase [Rhodoblastus sp.]
MTKVNIGALSLNVATAGPPGAPAVILAHPLGADLTVWDEVAPVLAERFFVLRFDARGHGGSDVPPGPYVLADFGGDVVALMDAFGLARAHFVGLSMSGGIGQWLMIHAPDRLDKVVLANTAPYFPGPDGWNARIRAARGEGMAGLAEAVAQRWLTPAFRARNPEKFAQIENLIRAAPPQGYAACCSALRDADLRDAIRAAPPRPVLVVVGESDASTPPALGEALARGLPDAQLLHLQAAHLSCVEAKDAFLAALGDFLS